MNIPIHQTAAPVPDAPSGKVIGYVRRWSDDPLDPCVIPALEAAGCSLIYEEVLQDQNSPLKALPKALGTLQNGDVLVTPTLEHIARSLRQLDQRMDEFARLGLTLRSIAENLDSRADDASSFRDAVKLLCEFEYKIVSDRTRRSLSQARAEGRRGGRQRSLTDDKIDQVKALLADPDLTVSQIAERVGVHTSTIYRHLPAARKQGEQS